MPAHLRRLTCAPVRRNKWTPLVSIWYVQLYILVNRGYGTVSLYVAVLKAYYAALLVRGTVHHLLLVRILVDQRSFSGSAAVTGTASQFTVRTVIYTLLHSAKDRMLLTKFSMTQNTLDVVNFICSAAI